MSDKKHIDRLFQEGFKDFEATPSDTVWKSIEAKLNEKNKKRRVIPIWWRYAGVAALLLLLLTVGGVLLNNTDDGSTIQVVDTENTFPEKKSIESNNPLNESTKTNTVVSDNDSQDESNESSIPQSEVITNKINPSKETSIAETSASKNKNESKTNLISSDKLNINDKNINVKIVAPRSNNTLANNPSEEKNNTKNLQKEIENNVAVSNTSEEKNKNVDSKNEASLVNNEKAKILIDEASKENKAIANLNNEKTEVVQAEENTEENKRSIEDALNNAKDVIEKDNNQLNNKWSVAPNVAPVYFNTLGDGSSIDPQFNSNSKSGDVNMSYGISTSYAINKKLSIRSGINSVNLGYNTNGVVVFQSVGVNTKSSSALQNINSSSNNVSLISSETLNSNAPASISSSNATINQNLKYIEIPLEIQYTISDKKFGINIIGGFSSFFLNNNETFYQEDNGNRTQLGEASNINNLSYSANFGLGLNYNVTKKFDLNLEPIFKYQFNTFNNTSGNFTPFIIGVYTGFAFKF